MKRVITIAVALLSLAMIASAQGMTGTAGSGSTDNGSMMAPADTSMAAPQGAMKASSDAMMTTDMSYAALKKANKLADTTMGMQLRAAMGSGMKTAYTSLESAEALAAKNPTVLFFSADWCPYCQADLKDINANGKKLGKVNVVVVDYDRSADVKNRYGVTMQDTYVQIGAMGEKITAWNGGGVDSILKNLKSGM
jgi:thiol-disulfide isomerase/thioredoxin